MNQIIPAIIPKNFAELEEKVRLVEPFVEWLQIDVCDGKFVPNISIIAPAEIAKLSAGGKTKLKLEAHLMIKNPEKNLDAWLDAVDRVVVHYEALYDVRDLQYKISKCIDKAQAKQKQIGIALNPETPWEVIKEFLGRLDLVLIMGVNPGFSGQNFIGSTLDKIRSLRAAKPSVIIEIDGGVTLENAKSLIAAGANYLISGSGVYGSDDIGKTINQFKEIIK
ncbi:MAG: ribulose-phosphate 3-epimerase [Patescibacteria group bacterium]|mgnify:CR=1 FL=1